MKAALQERQKITTHQSPSTMEATFHALLRSMGLLRQIMDPYFAHFGISGPQWGVLRILQRAESNGEGDLCLKDISQRLFIQPPSVTGVIDRMERLGLVKRSDSKADLRVRRVALTPQGRDLVKRVLVGHPDTVKKLFAAFEPRELTQFLALSKKWETHLATLSNRHPGVIAADNHQ